MNYKFPSSMDNNIPPIPDFNQNPNPNFSYITHQPIRGFTPNAEFEFPRNPIDVRGSILRELEKERIRARLIAEEIMERRILEEEVRRELMFERELTHRFVSPTRVGRQSVPMMSNFQREGGFRGGFETVPFQRDPIMVAGDGNGAALHEIKEIKGVVASPSQGSKDKVIILAKPSANLADIKRKAMTSPVGGAIEVFKKQKTTMDWSCALCQVTATSERGLHDHLQGKKHKTKERGMVSQRTGFDSGRMSLSSSPNTCKPVTPPTITSTPTVKKDEKVHNAPTPNTKDNHTVIDERENGVAKAHATGEPKKKFRYFCEMCQAGAYSMKVFNAHKKGKKHLAKLSEVGKTNDSTGVRESAPKAVTEKNKEVEITAGESKDGTKGELVETGRDSVDSDVNHVEGKVKVLEIINSETIAPKITDQEPVCSEFQLVSKTEDTIQGEGSAQKTIMEEIKEVEMAAGETKEETEEVETCRDVDNDMNRAGDKEKVLERVDTEFFTRKSICQESTWNEGGISDDATQVEEFSQKAPVKENKEVEMAAEETEEEIKVEEVEAKVDDVDRDVKLIVDEEKVLEINASETVAPKITDQELFRNKQGGITDDATRVEECTQKALVEENKEVEMAAEETKEGIKGEEVEANVDDVALDVKQIGDDEKVHGINVAETVAPKITDQQPFCNKVGC